jgi:hypothetical protein
MPEVTEQDLLQEMLPDLEADGYLVYVRPSRALLPEFLKDHTPDAIALRSDKNIAFEISRPTGQGKKKVEEAAVLFKDQPKWELRVLWLDPANLAASPPIQKSHIIKERLGEIKDLVSSGHPESSLLLGWATLEAIARGLELDRFERPQTPGRIVEVLAMEGHLTPSEADKLRVLAKKRNRLVHGELDVDVTETEMLTFSTILENLCLQHQV